MTDADPTLSGDSVAARPGAVYLVGAGPGDPGLITVRGLELLRQAEYVLYDGLVNPLLLRHAHARAERTARVDGEAGRVLKQDEINRKLIEAARAGLRVVRLKGGDPYIFGRGSEEAIALTEAGIPFEVVPGVTAATAAAVYSGLSLTHRDHASAVALVTGHEDPAKPETMLDYAALAAFPGTLVFYMGLHRLPTITASLTSQGKSPDTPAVVISRATTPHQRVVEGTLANIAERAKSAGLQAPSLSIVGDCATIRARAAWFEHRPLLGQSIAITRPEEQVDSVIWQAVSLGAVPVVASCIDVSPIDDWSAVDQEFTQLSRIEWLVFTSVNGVEAFLRRLWNLGGDARRLAHVRIAAIGPATAAAMVPFGFRADVVPAEHRAEALAEAMIQAGVANSTVLWARASRGRDVLPQRLAAAGATVRELVVYKNIDVDEPPQELKRRIASRDLNWIAVSSPSIARNIGRWFASELSEPRSHRPNVAVISPVTAAACEEAGVPVDVVAKTYTWDGLFDAMSEHVAASKTQALP